MSYPCIDTQNCAPRRQIITVQQPNVIETISPVPTIRPIIQPVRSGVQFQPVNEYTMPYIQGQPQRQILQPQMQMQQQMQPQRQLTQVQPQRQITQMQPIPQIQLTRLPQQQLAQPQLPLPRQLTQGLPIQLPLNRPSAQITPVPIINPTNQFKSPTTSPKFLVQPVISTRPPNISNRPLNSRQSQIMSPIQLPSTVRSPVIIAPEQSTIIIQPANQVNNRFSTVPTITNKQSTATIPARSSQIPVIPPLNTNIVEPKRSPPTTFSPIQPLKINRPINYTPIENKQPIEIKRPQQNNGPQPLPRRNFSPVDEDDEEIQAAIAASLRNDERNIMPEETSGEDYIEDEYLEDALLQEAINSSIIAGQQAREATRQFTQPILSERNIQLLKDRQAREEQDRAYEESLRLDREKEENTRKALIASERAAKAAEESARNLQELKRFDETRRQNMQAPILEYPIATSDKSDIFVIRVRLPTGKTATYSFHRDEPINSLMDQLRFELKYLDNFILTTQDGEIECPPQTSISECGIKNRDVITASYP